MKEHEVEELIKRIMPEVKRRIHELIIEERGINSKVRTAVMEALMVVKENIDKFANGETVNAKIKLDNRTINIYFDRTVASKPMTSVMGRIATDERE